MKKLWGIFFFASFAITAVRATEPEANANRDFDTFIYTLNLAPDSDAETVSALPTFELNQLAQREMSMARITVPELYAKFKKILDLIQPSLKKLYAAKQAILAGTFDREVRCLDVGCVAGFLIGGGIRISMGLVHTPLWTYPIFGIRMRFVGPFDPGLIAGFGVEVGAEKIRSSAENSDLRFFETVTGKAPPNKRSSDWFDAFGLGHYMSSSEEGHVAKGVTAGFGIARAQLDELRVQIPIKIPLYYFSYEKALRKKIQDFMQALYLFDFGRAELLAAEFNIQSERTLTQLKKRGLRDIDANVEVPEHPLSSPGMLFHPRTVQHYAPKELTPPNLTILDCEKAAKGSGLLGFKL